MRDTVELRQWRGSDGPMWLVMTAWHEIRSDFADVPAATTLRGSCGQLWRGAPPGRGESSTDGLARELRPPEKGMQGGFGCPARVFFDQRCPPRVGDGVFFFHSAPTFLFGVRGCARVALNMSTWKLNMELESWSYPPSQLLPQDDKSKWGCQVHNQISYASHLMVWKTMFITTQFLINNGVNT